MRALHLDTFAALFGAAWLSSFAVAAIGCTGAPPQGEGEGEGEGSAGGEGEGAVGEGEGSAGEGEGSVGEGEGSAGEGEGEGFGTDTVGDETSPLDVTVTEAAPFSTTTTIESGDDHDCYRFTTTDT